MAAPLTRDGRITPDPGDPVLKTYRQRSERTPRDTVTADFFYVIRRYSTTVYRKDPGSRVWHRTLHRVLGRYGSVREL